MMYRPYIIIFTLVVFVLAQTAARDMFEELRLRNSIRKCNTSDIVLGECVPYDECSRYNAPYSDANDFIQIRAQKGPCQFSNEVCCEINDVIINPIDPEPMPSHGWCGWRNPSGIGYRSMRISNGVTKFGEFPWTVVILKVEPKDKDDSSTYENLYLGGGSLIHPSVALTAAHIVSRGKSLVVRAGEWDTQTDKEVYPHQDKNVKEIVLHKDFNRLNLFYDIALLFLERPMVLAPNVGVVCLPPVRLRATTGSKCFASGWGMDEFGSQGQYQVVMKKVEVPVVDRNVCQKNLRNTRLGNFFELHTSFMCAGGEPGVDTCVGDGGSPLVCPIDFKADRYMQSGIVAWGLGCGDDGLPGVYVDVAELREWVDNEVVKKGLSTDFYTFE